jgi:hypothetical protein
MEMDVVLTLGNMVFFTRSSRSSADCAQSSILDFFQKSGRRDSLRILQILRPSEFASCGKENHVPSLN